MNIQKLSLSLSLGILVFSIFTISSSSLATFDENLEVQFQYADEIETAMERTIDANFTANGQVQFSAKGSTEDFSSFNVNYDSGLISGQKNKNFFSLSTKNEVFSANIKKSENSPSQSEDFLFPMHISGKYAGSFIADLDLLKFAGKFHYSDVSVTGNSRLENVVIGALELIEPLDNKWIELDFAQLFEEFPEILDDYEDTQEEIGEYLETKFSDEFESILLVGIDEGVLTISKSGNTYTIISKNPVFLAMLGGETPFIIITVNDRQMITDFSVRANVDVPMSNSQEISGKLFTQIHFEYGKNTIVWPVFQKNDWEVTKIVRMFFEFAQAELDQDKVENEFWYALDFISKKEKTVEEAVFDIGEYSDLDINKYLERNKNILDKKLGASDVFFLARHSGIELDKWDKDEVRNTFSFADDSYYNDSESKGTLLLELFIDDRYAYQPWDIEIDEESVYQLETKEDFLIFMARAILAK